MREGTVPALIIAAAVIAFVAYVSFEGSSHAVDFAVTGSDASIVGADDPTVGPGWRQPAQPGPVMLVGIAWQAEESIPGGSYTALVTTPPGWRHLGCRPECEWVAEDELTKFARSLPRSTYRLGASFDAEESGNVTLGFRPPRGTRTAPRTFVPTAWLVQTNGDDILGIDQIPLT
ncbi:MAG: hypothetical protein ACRDOJ_09505 [Nocardioidaceae bacterium]